MYIEIADGSFIEQQTIRKIFVHHVRVEFEVVGYSETVTYGWYGSKEEAIKELSNLMQRIANTRTVLYHK